jgi:hypothetical protein
MPVMHRAEYSQAWQVDSKFKFPREGRYLQKGIRPSHNTSKPELKEKEEERNV